MATTTAYAIRNSIATAVRGVTPSLLADTAFLEHRNEQPFRDWADSNPTAALRRFSVRELGVREPPMVSNGDLEWHETDFEVVIAYPISGRYGDGKDVDMDRVMESDQDLVETAIGLRGSIADAALIRGSSFTEREYGATVAFTVIRQRMGHYRSY